MLKNDSRKKKLEKLRSTEEYLGPCQTLTMEIFKKLADVLNALLLQIMRSEQLLKNRKKVAERQ